MIKRVTRGSQLSLMRDSQRSSSQGKRRKKQTNTTSQSPPRLTISSTGSTASKRVRLLEQRHVRREESSSSLPSMDESRGREENSEEKELVVRNDKQYRRSIIQSLSNSTLSSKSSIPMRHNQDSQRSKPTFLPTMETNNDLSKEGDDVYYESFVPSDNEDEEDRSVIGGRRDIVTVPQSISTQRSRQSTDSISIRQMSLIKIYSDGQTLVNNDNTLRILTKNVRKSIIPEVKFVPTSKGFGTFEQPDFTDDTCWMNKLFANIPTLKNATDTMKAEVWMTYKSKIKNEFSLHRSAVTLKIKQKFSESKTY